MKVCDKCIGEELLKRMIHSTGAKGKCRYCKSPGTVVKLELISDAVKRLLEEFYYRTPTDPEDVPMDLIKEFGWERPGDPVESIIAELLHVDEEPIAVDIRVDLESRYGDFGLAQIGEEDRFDEEAHYARKHVDDSEHQEKWFELDKTLKTESRFFNKQAQEILTEVFDDFESMTSRFGFSVIQKVGPNKIFSKLFRGRVVRRDNIKKVLAEPEKELGPPPTSVASDGRMNPHGVSVFYGASTPETVLAEVRPPVGAKVAIARFSLQQDVTLLNIRGF